MGCGASVHAQGSEQDAVQEPKKKGTPAPLAEDIQAARDPKTDEDVGKTGALLPAAGALPAGGPPGPAASAESEIAQSDTKMTCSSITTTTATTITAITNITEPETLSSRDEDVSSQVSSRSTAPDVATSTASAWAEELTLEPPGRVPSPRGGTSPPQSPQQLRAQAAGGGSASTQEATRLVLGSSATAAPSLERPTSSSTAVMSSGVFDPAVTPNSEIATVTLLPDAPGGYVPRARYTDESDLSINTHSYDLDGCGDDDSDDDELATLFTLQAWKRYYNYNKRKSNDLLSYFWKRFPPQDFSCFCISYRNQELLVAPFMAENCMHGYCARLADLGLQSEVFLQMYVLHDTECDQYRIVGLLLVAGQSLPPILASLSALDGFVYQRADTSRTLIKQFVSALLVGMSPLFSLKLISSREVL